tara:strand:- start:451 stop:1932 length:1482 start_codon:yes stop_codon:yes gene_type:complete
MLYSHKKLTFVITFLIFLFIQKNYGNTDFVNTKELKKTINYNLLYYKSDSLSSYKNISTKKFKKIPKSNSFGYLNGQYWFQLTIDKTVNASDIIAYIPTHNIQKIEIYQLINNQLKYISSTGNSVLQEKLPIDYKFPAFKIKTAIKSIFYLKVDFPKGANFPLKVIPDKNFISFIMNKKTINSFYYGTSLVIILLNLFFYFRFKRKIYLYYLLFLSSLTCNFLLYDGSLINYFRNNSNYYLLEFFIHFSGEIWFLLFSIKFLKLDKRHPFFTKLLYIFPFLVAVLYCCYFIYNDFILIAITDFIGVTLFPILWLFGFYYIKKIPCAKFYVLGYLLIVPFAVFFIIGYPFGFWEVYGDMNIVKIASWLDIIVFTYAISYRMKIKLEKANNKLLKLRTLKKDQKNLLLMNKIKSTNHFYILLSENKLAIEPLTLREIDILKLMCQNLNNIEISTQLFISKNTVKYHIRNIYAKASVKNREELKEKLSTTNMCQKK